MSLPPLYALRAFEAAARMESFSKAANILNITPGAVSRHIRTLEGWFGCELFERRGPRVRVNDAGTALAAQLTEGFMTIERACLAFNSHSQSLRLKTPSTLTMRWLLDVLNAFRERYDKPQIEITSVWMDTDAVDFSREPYDCAILLGNGDFGKSTNSRLLFREWLIPICSPSMLEAAQKTLPECDLIHPSPDRRDWRRWLKGTGLFPGLNVNGGKVFDTLEQGNIAALSGHGVSVGDLLLSLAAIDSGLLVLPFKEVIATGDGYYLVWPRNSTKNNNIDILYDWLKQKAPRLPNFDLRYHDERDDNIV
ncbi:LysR family transcriptional regulator [Lonsdalea iberica]|uniref:LysR family transcriptional regulator n=1 Tax=Lonsdalea iberica TaxID=1082703 RepID=A0ABX3XIN0_9GAMM|nr:LysR substrate-binding domain-containing protein [Lonsdalea iberica]OSN11427.1 LysR family transcriptional regulator [Lonsdalea iberica]